MFLRDLVRGLSRAGIDYCVVGGVAVNLHGVLRRTYNVDLVVPPERRTLHALAQLLESFGLHCREGFALEELADAPARRRRLLEGNVVAAAFVDEVGLREVFVVVSPPIEPARLLRRAVTLRLGPVSVRTAALDDLISIKRVSGQLRDADDVARLERLRRRSRSH